MKTKNLFAEEFAAQLESEIAFQEHMSDVEFNKHMDDVAQGQSDSVLRDAEQWVEDNYKAIKGNFVCKVCDEPTNELVADPSDKRAQFECRQCVVETVHEDLLDTLNS